MYLQKCLLSDWQWFEGVCLHFIRLQNKTRQTGLLEEKGNNCFLSVASVITTGSKMLQVLS